MEYKKGDILACWDNSIISKIIRYVTKSGASHVAIMYNNIFVIESWWNGVRIKKISDLKKRCNFYVLRYEKLTTEELNNVIQYLQYSYDRKYDFIQLITIGLHKLFGFTIKNNYQKYICSELIWEAYNSAGIEIVPQVSQSDEVVPGDLLDSTELAFIDMNII